MEINIDFIYRMLLSVVLCLCPHREVDSSALQKCSDGYEIDGEIADVPDGTFFYLVKNGGKDTVAYTKIMDGAFKFKGSLIKEGELHFIKLDTSFLKLPKGKKSYVRLLLDHSKIRLSGSFDKWPQVTIIGSNATDSFEFLYAEVLKRVDSTTKICDEIYAKVNEEGRQKKINEAIKLHYQNLYTFFDQHRYSQAIPFLVYNYAPDSVDFIMSLYNKFSQEIKNGYYANCLIEERVPQIKSKTQIAAGNPIPDLNSLFNREGKRVSILSIAKQNKLTLVDFWASWCKPCRAETPRLKEIYNEFHSRGFNIVGISHDRRKDSWLKAIQEDSIKWSCILDSANRSSGIFGLNGIPAYLLIDRNGKMIAFSAVSSIPNFGPLLTSDKLHNTIDSLLIQTFRN